MVRSVELLLSSFLRRFHARRSLPVENLLHRQPLAVPKRKHPGPGLTALDFLPAAAASMT